MEFLCLLFELFEPSFRIDENRLVHINLRIPNNFGWAGAGIITSFVLSPILNLDLVLCGNRAAPYSRQHFASSILL